MTIKLALASLLLGTSTLAAAAPGDDVGAPADDCEPEGAPAGYGSPDDASTPSGAYTPNEAYAPNEAYTPDGGSTPSGYPSTSPYPSQAEYPGYPAQPGSSQSGDYHYPDQAQSPSYRSSQPSRWDGGRRHRGPVTLASDVQLDGRGRRFINVGPQVGRFARLELKAQHGRTFIKQVYVQFDDGQEQVVRDIDRTVSRRGGLTLDLDGGRRAIRRIVVYGDGQRGGWGAGSLSITAS